MCLFLLFQDELRALIKEGDKSTAADTKEDAKHLEKTSPKKDDPDVKPEKKEPEVTSEDKTKSE